MRFPRAGGYVDIPVRWFFADNLPFLPGGTPYGSINWRGGSVMDPFGPGEVVGAPRPWKNGRNPNPNCCKGQPKAFGGAAVNGHAGYWLDCKAVSSGGVEIGGETVILWGFRTGGGVEVGGEGLAGYGLTTDGGVLLGGEGNVTAGYATEGGVEVGGEGAIGIGVTTEGGVEVGGEGAIGIGVTTEGGVEVGGEGAIGIGVTTEGGVELGGGTDIDAGYATQGGVEVGSESPFGYGWMTFGGVMLGGDTVFDSGTADPFVTGLIVMFGGAGSIPTGWLECDGSLVSKTTYAALWAVLGTTWGADVGGDFRLPDFRGRVPVGTGSGSGLTTRAIAATGGAETHTLSSSEIPNHTHPLPANTIIGGTTFPLQAGLAMNVWGAGTVTGSTGGGGSHNNMQPWVSPRFVIHI